MKVRARAVDFADAPVGLRVYLGQSFTTAHAEYEVHAISLFEGRVFVQIVDDRGHPSWRPMWLFETSDRTVPNDWICNASNEEPGLIIGPDFVAQDSAAYASMVELEPLQKTQFWKRIRQRCASAPDDFSSVSPSSSSEIAS